MAGTACPKAEQEPLAEPSEAVAVSQGHTLARDAPVVGNPSPNKDRQRRRTGCTQQRRQNVEMNRFHRGEV